MNRSHSLRPTTLLVLALATLCACGDDDAPGEDAALGDATVQNDAGPTDADTGVQSDAGDAGAPVDAGDVPSAFVGTLPAGERLIRNNISWTFDLAIEFGYFVNGDVYVVHPGADLNITDIEYFDGSDWIAGDEWNGSMVNPNTTTHPDHAHGLTIRDEGSDYYAAEFNIALSLPYAAAANQSIVSTGNSRLPVDDGDSDERSGFNHATGTTALYDGEVLTILAEHARLNDFRPPYAGTDKSILANKSDMDYEALGSLTPASGAPAFASLERQFERPWIIVGSDHAFNRVIRPYNNMQDYGRDMNRAFSNTALLLNCDYSDAEKEVLAINLSQVGIDMYGLHLAGYEFPTNGGNAQCSKGPMVVGGAILGVEAMRDIGNAFTNSEDSSTFYVSARDVDAGGYRDPFESGAGSVTANPGTYLEVAGANWDIDIGTNARGNTNALVPGMVINNVTTGASAVLTALTSNSRVGHSQLTGPGRTTWDAEDAWEITDLGMVEWFHTSRDGDATREWYVDTDADSIAYRAGENGCCTTITWAGFVLSIEAMGLQSNWNHDPMFEYTERWMSITGGDEWHHRMYDENHLWSVFPDPAP